MACKVSFSKDAFVQKTRLSPGFTIPIVFITTSITTQYPFVFPVMTLPSGLLFNCIGPAVDGREEHVSVTMGRVLDVY